MRRRGCGAAAITRAVGTAHVQKIAPIMPSEDFAWYRTRVPGAMLLLGAGDAQKETNYPQHHCKFNSDDDTLPVGAAAPAPRRVILWRRKRSRFVQNPTCAFAESMI